MSSIFSSSSISVELSGSESSAGDPLTSVMVSPKSSEMLLSRGDLHRDMDLTSVESTWLLLHAVALPYNEQQDIDLEEYVVVETTIFDFFEDLHFVCPTLK